MFWGPEDVRAGGYAEELAAFVLGRRGDGRLAVLWPEHDPPVTAADGGGLGPWLAARLTELVGRTVVELPAGSAHEGGTFLGSEHGDVLLIQVRGTAAVRPLSLRGREDAPRPRLRVRPGEVLFLPAGLPAVVQHEAGTRHVLLRIAAGADRRAAVLDGGGGGGPARGAAGDGDPESEGAR